MVFVQTETYPQYCKHKFVHWIDLDLYLPLAVTVTSPVQSETDQGELTLVPPPKEPDQILQPLAPPKTIR